MTRRQDALRGQTQALTAFSFALAVGLVARGFFTTAEMREIIEAADINLPDDHHPVATQMLALMIAALPDD